MAWAGGSCRIWWPCWLWTWISGVDTGGVGVGLFSCRAHTHWPPCAPPASQNFLHKWDRRSHLQSLPRDPDPTYEMTTLELLFGCVAAGQGEGRERQGGGRQVSFVMVTLPTSPAYCGPPSQGQGGDPEHFFCSCYK